MSRQSTGARHYLRSLIGHPRNEEGSDGQLLEQYVRQRNECAFAALVQRYGPLVYGVCARLLQNAHDAEDAFQATFLVLARKADSLDQRGPLGNWLYTVAVRTATKARVAIARRRLQEWRALEMASPNSTSESDWAELRPVLDEELNQLPAKYRMILVLCYLEGKTHQQAARELGWPSGSLSRRMSRARELLRRRLERRGIALSSVLLFGLLSRHAVTAKVSSTLAAATAKAAVLFGAGQMAAHTSASVNAVSLAEEILLAMGRVKWAGMGSLLLYLCFIGVGGIATSVGVRAAITMMPAWGAHVCSPPSTALLSPETKEAASVPAGPEEVYALALAPGGKRLAIGGRGEAGGILIWNLDPEGRLVNPGNPPITLPATGVRALAFSTDGSLLASASADGRVEVWTVATPKSQRRWRSRAHPEGTLAVTFAPRGRFLASAGGDGRVRVWEVSSGDERATLAGHEGPVRSIAFSPGGRTMASGGDDRLVRVWDVSTWRERSRMEGHADTISAVAFAADGQRLLSASYDHTIRLWDLETREVRLVCSDHASPIRAAAFVWDGAFVVSLGDGSLKFWNTRRASEISSLRVEVGPATALAAAPDRMLIATGGPNQFTRLWQVNGSLGAE